VDGRGALYSMLGMWSHCLTTMCATIAEFACRLRVVQIRQWTLSRVARARRLQHGQSIDGVPVHAKKAVRRTRHHAPANRPSKASAAIVRPTSEGPRTTNCISDVPGLAKRSADVETARNQRPCTRLSAPFIVPIAVRAAFSLKR